MKVLLTYLRYDGDIYMDSYEQDHLGLGYIAAVLRNDGHSVKLINAHFSGMSLEELIETLEPLDFDIIGIPLHVETLYDLYRLTEWLHLNKKKAHIVIGGHWAGTEPEKLFEILPKIDYIITGEGEYIFLDLVKAIENNTDLGSVTGLAWKKEDSIVVNSRRPLIENLDELPYPIRDDLEIYNEPLWDFKKRTANISASRGCYANCSFCSIKSFYNASPGKIIRFRDPIKVVDEIEFLKNTYRVNQIFISDDNFCAPNKVKPGWCEQLANEIINRNLDIKFIFMTRVDDIEMGLFKLLKQAGLIGVAMGIESDVDRVLEDFDKKTSKKKNREALRILRELRIDPLISFIMFDPYTTLDEIRENLKFFKDINYTKYFHYSRPLTLVGGYDLKTYGGTPLTVDIQNDKVNQDGKFAYECDYKDIRVAQVFDLLQQWRVNLLKVVMHNPVWLIDIANRLGEIDIAYRLHGLARKYIKQDENMFYGFVDLAEQGFSSKSKEAQDFLEAGNIKLNEIDDEFTKIEMKLESLRSEKRENNEVC